MRCPTCGCGVSLRALRSHLIGHAIAEAASLIAAHKRSKR